MKSRKFGIALILLVPIGLVAGPVLWAGMRSEIAHWYLAAGANAIDIGKGDAEKSLEAARAWDPEVGGRQDYLIVRLRQLKSNDDMSLSDVFKDVPEERKPEIADRLASQFASKGDFAQAADVMRVLLGEKANQNIIYWDVLISRALEKESEARAIEVLREAIAANPDNSNFRTRLAGQYAYILSKREDFASSLEAYKIWFGEKYDRDISTLNTLAYGRALANVELDQALTDINEALSYHPEDPDLRDTRAWVYCQLGRYEEALLDADFSVKAKESPSFSSWFNRQLERLQNASVSPPTSSPPTSSTSRDETKIIAGDENVAVDGASAKDPPVVMLDPPKVYLTQNQTSPTTWSLGVVRYHRARILEKLGRTDEANADWEWIEKERLPPDDRLH